MKPSNFSAPPPTILLVYDSEGNVTGKRAFDGEISDHKPVDLTPNEIEEQAIMGPLRKTLQRVMLEAIQKGRDREKTYQEYAQCSMILEGIFAAERRASILRLKGIFLHKLNGYTPYKTTHYDGN
jgi:hypothetical protein